MSLHRPFSSQYHHYRLEKNLQIQSQRKIKNIFRIQRHNFLEIRDVTSSAYLPHASKPRSCRKPPTPPKASCLMFLVAAT